MNVMTSRIRVLLLDDDPEDMELYRDYLDTDGSVLFDITDALSITRAEQELRDRTFDVALIDYHLGARDGISFIEQFASSRTSPAMILMTGKGAPGTDVAALRAGAVNYLEKGDVTPDELVRTIRFAAQGRQALLSEHKARDAAERLANARSEMLAQTSHDFRTPLNAIIGFSDMIKGEMLGPISDERYKEFAQLISESGHHLLSLVNQMLLSTQLDQGSLVLDPKPVNFSEIGRQIVRMMETMAENKGIELVNDSQVDLVHPADERSVRQIIINLLSNALKFTDRGRVTLCIRRESEGGQVEVSISDTGPGIPEAELGRLTEAYYQSKADSTKARSGAGLGLSIVNGLVIAHGGELTIESRVGEGSVFTATFPPLDPA